MQQNIFQYKSLESEANLMQSRIDRLEEISEYFSRYQETKTNIRLCSYIIDKIEQRTDENGKIVYRVTYGDRYNSSSDDDLLWQTIYMPMLLNQ